MISLLASIAASTFSNVSSETIPSSTKSVVDSVSVILSTNPVASLDTCSSTLVSGTYTGSTINLGIVTSLSVVSFLPSLSKKSLLHDPHT